MNTALTLRSLNTNIIVPPFAALIARTGVCLVIIYLFSIAVNTKLST